MSISYKWGSLIVFAITSICCIMPALLLYFLGYVANSNWDRAAIKTSCNVTAHQVEIDTCSYECGCYRTTSVTLCNTCYYTCFDGYITLDYVTSNGIAYTNTIEIDAGWNYSDDVINDLNKNYPIGNSITCYYNPDNPTNVKLKLANTKVFFGFFIVFCCLGGLIVLGWIIFILYTESYLDPIINFLRRLC